ncbi:MAG: glutamate 5-kinase [Aestuariivita sp.]|nr:glutamate 5-kinase [Aestuariivita sp.]
MASLTGAACITVKIGSALLVDSCSGKLRRDWLQSLSDDVANLKSCGSSVVIVSSGAIVLGCRALNFTPGNLSLEQSQAAAAVGQIRLARAYEEAFAPHNISTAQVLVTLEDSHNRRRYLNSRATMKTLLSLGVIPIVNENDTIATDEIRYGDNDRLAAQVAVTVGADRLILLSDVDGLYSSDPTVNPNAKHLKQIREITEQVEKMAGDTSSSLSKGGMKTKILAAKTAVSAGCAMVITLGTHNNPLKKLDKNGKSTWFLPQLDPQVARKRWIAAMKPAGSVLIDGGAAQALKTGKSLLAAGVRGVTGAFERGDPVSILDSRKFALGKGLIRYNSSETLAIKGCRSDEMEEILGYPSHATLIHRDDMAL